MDDEKNNPTPALMFSADGTQVLHEGGINAGRAYGRTFAMETWKKVQEGRGLTICDGMAGLVASADAPCDDKHINRVATIQVDPAKISPALLRELREAKATILIIDGSGCTHAADAIAYAIHHAAADELAKVTMDFSQVPPITVIDEAGMIREEDFRGIQPHELRSKAGNTRPGNEPYFKGKRVPNQRWQGKKLKHHMRKTGRR